MVFRLQCGVGCLLFPGDIGGQMGLFIGASILTILEILDYIYEVQPPSLCLLFTTTERDHSKLRPSIVAARPQFQHKHSKVFLCHIIVSIYAEGV